YILNYLKVENIVENKTTKHFTLFTVLNYDQYQPQLENKFENKLKTNKKQIETKDKDNKDNKENKEIYSIHTIDNSHSISSIHSKDKDVEIARTIDYLINQEALLKDFKNKVFEKYNVSFTDVKRKAEELYNYCQAKGKRYKNYRAFLRNAIVRDFGYKFKN
ncbi:MAG: hypothetical protein NC917_07110, partial [Candidatus Omnitrophica bacterium]|nr:hypothetical protein [Candidatus Omnitrophota bacterium]